MPLYEYACKSCGSDFEKLRPMSEGHEAHCPECGQVSKRVLSLIAAPVHVGVGAGFESASPSGASCCGGACGCS